LLNGTILAPELVVGAVPPIGATLGPLLVEAGDFLLAVIFDCFKTFINKSSNCFIADVVISTSLTSVIRPPPGAF
jgi:hypothetical protein